MEFFQKGVIMENLRSRSDVAFRRRMRDQYEVFSEIESRYKRLKKCKRIPAVIRERRLNGLVGKMNALSKR